MRKWLKNWTDSYLNFILKNSKWVIGAVLFFVILAGLGITRISIDSDMLHWFARNSEIAKLQYYINDTFKVNNPIIIMLETGDVFTYGNISLIRKISKMAKDIPGVNEVLSITEIDDIQSTAEGVNIGKLFPPDIPKDAKTIEAVKKYVMSLEKYSGTLVSSDGKSAAIIIKAMPDAKSDVVAKEVKSEVNKYLSENRKDVKAYFAGVPAIMNSITDIILGDMSLLVPLVALVILLALFISFRHPYGTLLPLLTVSLATVASMGIMGYLGMPLTPIGIAIPVVMMAIGNAYGIYIVNEYHEKTQLFDNKKDVVKSSVKRLVIPITMSGLTVFAGFMSLVTASGLKAIIDFSIVNAIGVILSFVFTLTFMPAVLMVLPLAKRRFKSGSDKESGVLRTLAVWIVKHKAIVLTVIVVFAGCCAYYATKITSDSDYLKYFKEGSEPRMVSDKVSDVFQGTGELILYFKGDVTDPRVLKGLTIIEENARYHAGSKSRASSVVEMIATLNANMTQVKRLPDTMMEVNNLWFFIEGNEQISKMVSRNKDEFTSSFLLPFQSSDQRYRMLAQAEGDIKTNSTVNFIKTTDDRSPSINLASLMLYNRFVRRDINIPLERIRNYISNMVMGADSKEYSSIIFSYAKQKTWLEKLSDNVRSGLLGGDARISREDLVYALSPLVWNEIPVPDASGTALFRQSGMSGIVKLFSDMDRIVVDNQITSIITAVIIVMILIALMFRSILTGALSILTVVFTVIVNFGFMGIT
ncbi:MAG: MMPL family transporter, partial [Brevinematales bacterium]